MEKSLLMTVYFQKKLLLGWHEGEIINSHSILDVLCHVFLPTLLGQHKCLKIVLTVYIDKIYASESV